MKAAALRDFTLGGLLLQGAQPVLTVNSLTVDYLTQAGPVEALEEVDLSLRRGEVVGLVGESGSGKSTLVKASMGLLRFPARIRSGEVKVGDKEMLRTSAHELRSIRGKQIGMIPPNPHAHLDPLASIGQQIVDVLLAHEEMTKEDARERAVELLTAVGLPDPRARMSALPHELSGGMAQRTVVATALSCSPRVIVADEPTFGLDVTIQVRILDLIADLIQSLGCASLIATRDLGIVANYCQRVIVLERGRVVEASDIPTFFRSPQHSYSKALLRAVDIGEGDVPLRRGKQLKPRGARTTLAGPYRDKSEVEAGASSRLLVSVRNLRKYFPAGRRAVVHAVNDVSFDIREGGTLALVGESGSGKTTVGRCLARLLEPTRGEIYFNGQSLFSLSDRAFRALRSQIQVVFQDPFESLNPRMTVQQMLAEPLSLLRRMDRRESREEVEKLLATVNLGPEFLHREPRQLTGGQQQKVAIARALAPRPRLIVLDEATSSLDPLSREEIISLLMGIQAELGTSYLFISHDLTAVRTISHDVAVMYLGQIVESAPVDELFAHPMHPYSRALLSSALFADPEQSRPSFLLRGEIPSPINPPSGCFLHPRCPLAIGPCETEVQVLEEVRSRHPIACWRIAEDEELIDRVANGTGER